MKLASVFQFELSPVSRAQLVSILCRCLLCVRHRPDLASSAALQTILASLVTVEGAGRGLRAEQEMQGGQVRLSRISRIYRISRI